MYTNMYADMYANVIVIKINNLLSSIRINEKQY